MSGPLSKRKLARLAKALVVLGALLGELVERLDEEAPEEVEP